jgi:hypothetical protein
MILVFGTEQRLLCMAHLIGADSLPSKDQLDPNLVRILLSFDSILLFINENSQLAMNLTQI